MNEAEVRHPLKAGCVQVYTGSGKGKTTAALGLALRAAGHGMRTYVGQFLKKNPTGELVAAERLAPLLVIEQFGREGFYRVTEETQDEDSARARDGLRRSRQAMTSGSFDVVVLDEVNVALHFGLLTEAEMLDFLAARPPAVEVVCTGRLAPDFLTARADLVTEMVERKHYAARGVPARVGIEK